MAEAAVILKPGREKSLRARHPWVFSGAIQCVEGEPTNGEAVVVRSADGAFLARAAYSPFSQIRARIWSWSEDEAIDADFFRRRIAAALQARQALIRAEETNALRLVHAESDGLPGLVVDRYDRTLVLQVLTAGIERWKEDIVDILVDLTGVESVYERSDVDVRKLEGLPEKRGLLRGHEPTEPLRIVEDHLMFEVDVIGGQKTGFYIDQRENRARLKSMAAGRRVLNCFCYTGGFSLYALAGGATQVISMDSSAEALAGARRNAALNGFALDSVEWVEADVFQQLRRYRDSRQSFDLIVLDPPKFAPTAAQVERAARAYKDINLLAFKLLNPGGLLFTFSCSGGVSAELFQKIVAGAALDANADARIIGHMTQGRDHPVALHFPEGAYLKGLICQVTG